MTAEHTIGGDTKAGRSDSRGHTLARKHPTDFPPGLSWRDWFTAVGERFGFPIACLFAVCAAVGMVCHWMAIEVVKPVADRHIRFIDVLESERSKDKDVLRDISGSIQDLANQQRITNQILRRGEGVSKGGDK